MKNKYFTAIIMLVIAIATLTTASATEVTIQGIIISLDDGTSQTEFSSTSGTNTVDGTVGKPNDLTAALSYSQESMVAPICTNFDEETTDFSTESNLTNVLNMTLAKTGGKIMFAEDYGINTDGEDYDANIKIEDQIIFVNSSALHSSFNNSATLTFYNVDCNKPYVFYSETASTFAGILKENQRCPESLCSNIQCLGSTLTLNVEHFTGYAAGTDANLTIESEAGVKMPSDPIAFYAWYINSTDGTPISGECNISFDDAWGTWFEMDYNGSEYNYTKSSGFNTTGTHDYNVTCSSANFVTLEANDTKVVGSVDIPEFSAITLGLGLIAILTGLIIIRKKK
ncbi:MAG: hypothetical protein KAS15_07050 [Nanoarchaeota archaeon]|nr:hypothetical protein [Nanoarchaeota archaeon]